MIVKTRLKYRKKHPVTFSFTSPRIICGFKQKLQLTYPRIDRFWQCKNEIFNAIDDVIMTSHFVLLKLERVYSTQKAVIPSISFFASIGYLLVHRHGRIVHYVAKFKTIILTLNKFSFINLIKFDHHWHEIMLQQLNVADDSYESTLVLKRKADILSISYDISIHQWHSNILVDVG